MNNKNIIDYRVVRGSITALPSLCQNLYDSVAGGDTLAVRLVFCYGCSDTQEYQQHLNTITTSVEQVWGESRPIVTLVSQPTISGDVVVEMHLCTPLQGESVEFATHGSGGRIISLQSSFGLLYFIGELQGDTLSQSIEVQSNQLFSRLEDIFTSRSISPSDIVRQWNYIERITELENGNQHYQLFNNARSHFYESSQWSNGYPAATGIGADSGGVVIDIDVLIPSSSSSCSITPIDNRRQIAAHLYSDSVLIAANTGKTTPKFERAKSLSACGYTKLTYISGTAAITGEESLHGVAAKEQTIATLDNIYELVENPTHISLLRVYIKNTSDHQVVKEVVSSRHPNVDTIYLKADVCREELLVEIECVAYSPEL